MTIRPFLLLLPGLWILIPAQGKTLGPNSITSDSSIVEMPKEFSIGVDVLKNISHQLVGKRMGLIIGGELEKNLVLETTFTKKLSENRNWVGLLGHANGEIKYNSGIEQRNQFSGWYAKGGKERVLSNDRFKVGLLAIATFCRYRTDLRYPGRTFGDYTETREIDNFGLGAEPYSAYDYFLGSRWVIRWVTRLSFHVRMNGEGYTPYYPGIGNVAGGYGFIFSGGTTLQLHYRFFPQR